MEEGLFHTLKRSSMSVKKEKVYIIKAHTINDADRIIVFLTESGKKKSGVAKNALRLKSRFSGKIEPYNICNLEYYEKNDESGNLCSINSVEVEKSCFKSVGGNMTKFTALSLLNEILDNFVYGFESSPKVFRLTEHCLTYFENKDANISAVLSYFIYWLLKLSGVMPQILQCSVCGVKLENQSFSLYNDKEMFCSDHSTKGIKISSSQISTVIKMDKTKLSELAMEKIDFKELFGVMFTVLSLISEKEFKSYQLLKTFL